MERKSRLGSILFSLVLEEMALYGRGPTLCRWNNMSWISSRDPLDSILSQRFASPRVPKVVTTFSSLKVCLHSILTKSIQRLPISTQLSSCSSLHHRWVKPLLHLCFVKISTLRWSSWWYGPHEITLKMVWFSKAFIDFLVCTAGKGMIWVHYRSLWSC